MENIIVKCDLCRPTLNNAGLIFYSLTRFHFDLTEFYNGWGFVLGQITFVNTLVNTQYMVQRMVVCKSEAVARA